MNSPVVETIDARLSEIKEEEDQLLRARAILAPPDDVEFPSESNGNSSPPPAVPIRRPPRKAAAPDRTRSSLRGGASGRKAPAADNGHNAAIVEHLRANPDSSMGAIVKALGLRSNYEGKRAMSDLVKDGTVVTTGQRAGTRYKLAPRQVPRPDRPPAGEQTSEPPPTGPFPWHNDDLSVDERAELLIRDRGTCSTADISRHLGVDITVVIGALRQTERLEKAKGGMWKVAA